MSMWKKIAIAAAIVCGVFLWWATRVTPGSIIIEQNSSITRAVEKMHEAGIIRSPLVARAYIKIFKSGAEVFPGELVIPSDVGWVRVMGRLIMGDRAAARITFPEGDDIRDMQKRLAVFNTGIDKQFSEITGESARFTNKDTTLEEKFYFLRGVPKRISYEGYLFPDTYEVGKNQRGRELVVRMLEAFDTKVNQPFAADVAASGHTLHEIITVASILEKEVKLDDDRVLVADIMWRRLNVGMPLQMDATVTYMSGSHERFTTKTERKTPSPWNTYASRGLPIGPIANPGVASVRAALHPRANNYWFYLTDPSGKAHYARTLEEHGANKKYLK